QGLHHVDVADGEADDHDHGIRHHDVVNGEEAQHRRSLDGELFGLVSLATVFGVIGLAAQVGSGLGPWAIGLIEDRTGSYTTAFALGAGLTFLAAVIVLAARPPQLEPEPRQQVGVGVDG
ncbi:MAG: hypothetical protein AAFN30_18035, partial [Actinomycetota bacterium]